LLKDLEIKPRCVADQFGLQEKDPGHMVDVYQNDFCSLGNPGEFNPDEVLALPRRVGREGDMMKGGDIE
jgi:hypothetical protein